MEHVKLFGQACSPSKEYASDDAKWAVAMLLFDQVFHEFLEGWFQRIRGFKEADEKVVGHGIGVLGVGREAVVGAGKGDLDEANVGVRRNGRPELLDVEGVVDKCYGVLLSLFYAES
jgi:hypothetical protein